MRPTALSTTQTRALTRPLLPKKHQGKKPRGLFGDILRIELGDQIGREFDTNHCTSINQAHGYVQNMANSADMFAETIPVDPS